MIAVKRYVDDSPIISTSIIEFSPSNKIEYIDLFNKFKKNKIIDESSEFYEDKWILKSSVDKRSVSFIFSEPLFKKMTKCQKLSIEYADFILAVKSFYLFQLSSYTTDTLIQFINSLKNFTVQTEFTNKKNLSETLKNNNTLMDYTPLILEFFMYYEELSFNDDLLDELGTAYLDSLAIKRESSDCKRALPTFNTMFKFNDIMNEFIRTSTGDTREKFFPLILWWRITTILPLRSREFTIIPKDCLVPKDGEWFIKLYRSKRKGNGSKIYTHEFNSSYELSTHKINDEIKDLIVEYLNLVSQYDTIENYYSNGIGNAIERTFLLSARSYYKFNRNKGSYYTYKYTLDYFSPVSINKLLKRFLVEIVYGEHGIEIVPKQKKYTDCTDAIFSNYINSISLMDTRHFAIMNMVYMGCEANTIQRIVGHKSIQTSYNYFSHVEIFTNCYTVSVAKQMAFAKNSDFKNAILDMDFESLFGNEGDGNSRYRTVKAKRLAKNDKFKKLDDGYCTYEKSDLVPCKLLRGNHQRCKFFSPYPDKISTVSEELEKISTEISSEIETLRYLAINNKKIKNFNDLYNVSLNKIHSKVLTKAEMICDYIITGTNEK